MRDDRGVSEHRAATATFLFTDIEGSTGLLKHSAAIGTANCWPTSSGCCGRRSQRTGARRSTRRATRSSSPSAAPGRPLAAADRDPACAWPRTMAGRRGGAGPDRHPHGRGSSGRRPVYRLLGPPRRPPRRAGHGGQVLVSHSTRTLVEDDLPDARVLLRDLGSHRLKDIDRPEPISQLDIEGLPATFAPFKANALPPPRRGLKLVAVAAILTVAAAAAAAFVLLNRRRPLLEVVPNSVVRINPDTGKPTMVIPVGRSADLVVSAGGYVWTAHQIFRQQKAYNAGDRAVTRIDPSSGEAVVVGGGLAPCGLAGDPSGDVLVANCYDAGGGTARGNVVRVVCR